MELRLDRVYHTFARMVFAGVKNLCLVSVCLVCVFVCVFVSLSLALRRR